MQLWKNLHERCVPSKENAYRPSILGRASVAFFLATVLAVEGFLVASVAAQQSDGSFLSAVIASDIITFTNSARQTNAQGTLQEDMRLDTAAQAKADDMARQGYFAHVSPDGTLPWVWITSAGYDYQYAGENLAVRFSDSKDVVNAWMASPTHRRNLLDPNFTTIGVGTAQGMYQGRPATFVVQFFASPKPGAGSPSSNSAAVALAQPANSFMQSLGRQMVRLLSDPVRLADWALGGIAVLFLLAVALAFFLHIEVQAHDLLAGGTIVAAIALLALCANMHFLSPTITPQTAGVITGFDQFDGSFSTTSNTPR